VAEATIRQREAARFSRRPTVERSRNLFHAQLLPQQTLDDAERSTSRRRRRSTWRGRRKHQSQARLDERA